MPPRDYDAELREGLRRIRTQAKLTQDAVAAGLNTNQTNVSRWELELNPTLSRAADFASVCGYELDVRFYRLGELREVKATKDGARAAELVDALTEEDRALVLRLLAAMPQAKFRQGARGMVLDVIDSLEELARREERREKTA